MKNARPSKITLLSQLLLAGWMLSSCSVALLDSSPSAVEVGNPEDSDRRKPNQPAPLQLVQVTLETKALEEIEKVEFKIDSINLSLRESGSEIFASTSTSGQKSTKLTLVPGSKNKFEFAIPRKEITKKDNLFLSLKFDSKTPGVVTVASEQIEIEEYSQTLTLKLDNIPANEARDSTLSYTKTITKNDLFESSTMEGESKPHPRTKETDTNQSPATNVEPLNPSKVTVPPAIQPSPTPAPEQSPTTTTKSSTKPVYRLKSGN
jgi:hypothetical protein